MNQPTTPAIEHRSVIFTTDEIKILLAFINSGMKADVNTFGLSDNAGNTVMNAIHLAKKLQDATPVQQLKVAPPERLCSVDDQKA